MSFPYTHYFYEKKHIFSSHKLGSNLAPSVVKIQKDNFLEAFGLLPSKSYVIIAFPSYAFPAFEETLNRYLNALFTWYYIEYETIFSEDDFSLPQAKIIGFANNFA